MAVFLLVGANTGGLAARLAARLAGSLHMGPIAEAFMVMEADTEETHQDSRTRVADETDSKNMTNLMKGP